MRKREEEREKKKEGREYRSGVSDQTVREPSRMKCPDTAVNTYNDVCTTTFVQRQRQHFRRHRLIDHRSFTSLLIINSYLLIKGGYGLHLAERPDSYLGHHDDGGRIGPSDSPDVGQRECAWRVCVCVCVCVWEEKK